ncbi:hypothetical protein [Mumia sp. DW29H23]|uniref:hypothetical protein n=1 Tax=Mumia sp. DW29H23 TaxID=3421241 RepID=UPI003D6950DB
MQLSLPDGTYAYGRVLKDTAVAFYETRTSTPGHPPVGERRFNFVVGVFDDVLGSEDTPVVGTYPSTRPDDDWPPSFRVDDPISGSVSIYERGSIRDATPQEASGLEPAAVWDLEELIDRLMAGGG